MGHRVDRVVRPDHERRVLLGVTGRQPQLAVRGEEVAVAIVVEPQVVPVARPEVDDLGVREQRDVDRVVGVVVAQEDVADGVGRHAESRQRVEDERAPGDHPRVHDDERIAVADEHDAAADAVVRVSGVEEVDAGHRGDATRSGAMPRGRAHPLACSRSPDTHAADLVLRGGRIETMDAAGARERRGGPGRPDRRGRQR